MKPRPTIQLPEEIRNAVDRARRVETISLILMISCVILVYLTLGQSEAMKAIWVEDILAVIPPAAYLISDRIRWRDPNKEFVYGYQHAGSIAFLASALVLATLGILVLFDGLRTLLTKEHPTVGVMSIFGHQVWLGWLMIAVLCYTISCELGVSFLKKPLVEKLHDKTISADARMNRADWMTGVTGIIGVAGIGFGLWWLDSVAACLIAIEIIRDGWENLRDSVTDLMDQVPTKATESEPEGWADKLKNRMSDLDWVGEVDVRLREEGNVITGEVFVVPKTTEGFEKRSGELQDLARDLDWRFYDLSLIAVEKL